MTLKKYNFYKITATIALFLFYSFSIAQTSKKFTDKDIEALIAKMTLEEKVGQMTNLTLATVAKEKGQSIVLSMDSLRDALVKHNIGSIQNVIDHAYSIDDWHKLVTIMQDMTLKETRLKIPFMYCIDAVHGTNFTLGSTLFPHNIAMAATRNPELARQCAEITAKEVRASGIRWDFSPVLDVGRQPLWPRFGETFGEDVYVVKTMGTATIKGYEGKDLTQPISVASCMKHYVGYSVPANGKDRAAAYIPEIVLREYFLPPFKAAVDAGAHTLMVNSAEVNGTPVHASKYLLTDVLRKELDFKGVVISDWEDIKKLHERHRVAESFKEAAGLAVNAGIDMCIVPFDYSFYNDVIALVKEGKISQARIDEAVRRILKFKADLGLFNEPYIEKEAVKNFGLPEYKQTALQAARESITLLKNEGNILPLAKNKKIIVVGPGANSLSTLNGAWSYAWQGQKPQYFPADEPTIFTVLKKNAAEVKYYKGAGFDTSSTENLSEALADAKTADYIIICIGEDAYAETPGNIKDLELPEGQQKLVKEMAAVGKPVIWVLTEGRPRIVREIEPLAQGIILAYWPASQGANAIADVLFGDFNPCGKLPFTYPRYSGEIMTYDHKPLDEAVEKVSAAYKYYYEFNPQWPFGHGLSYTTFTYSGLTLSIPTLSKAGKVKVSLTVQNTGKTAGMETVELYTRDMYASVTPSVKRLRKFTKISLAPGASQKVEFELGEEDLAFVGQDLKWITEPGDFELMVGELKATLKYTGK